MSFTEGFLWVGLLCFAPMFIFIIMMYMSDALKILHSTLMLITSFLMGIAILMLFPSWFTLSAGWICALGNIGMFIFSITKYFEAKGNERQFLLTVNEEIRSGNYEISLEHIEHISAIKVNKTMKILKSKGLLSHKVTYSPY